MGGFSSFAVSFSIISVLTGCITAYADAIGPGGPAALGLGWPLVSAGHDVRGARDGRARERLPHRRRALSLVGAPRQRRLGLAHGGDEPRRPGRDRRGDRLRLRERARGDARPVGARALRAARGDPREPCARQRASACASSRGSTTSPRRCTSSASSSSSARCSRSGARSPSRSSRTPGFTTRADGSIVLGFANGLVLSMFTFTGYDASAHLAEETHDPARRTPWGILSSVGVSAVAGYLLLAAHHPRASAICPPSRATSTRRSPSCAARSATASAAWRWASRSPRCGSAACRASRAPRGRSTPSRAIAGSPSRRFIGRVEPDARARRSSPSASRPSGRSCSSSGRRRSPTRSSTRWRRWRR